MSRLSKSLLVASLATSAVGVFVSFTPITLPLVWTVALPFGAILCGTFLISFVFHDHLFSSRQKEISATRSVEQKKSPLSTKDSSDHGAIAPHQLAHG